MSCRWDRDAQDYLVDGEPCRVDEYGDPTNHCTGRRCSNHIGQGELTCARCIGRARNDVRRIVELAPLTAVQALGTGVDSEAANLAGPGADYGVFSARRNLDRFWLMTNIPEVNLERAMRNLLPDDDEDHPYSVLTRWEFMLREDYDQQRDDPTSVASAGAYLERTLGRIAQDDEQDFALFASEIRHCRNHLEAVLRNSTRPERGAPCPDCRDDGRVERMRREYGHWCDDLDCTKVHYADDAGDIWRCPRDRSHWRTHDEYVKWIEERETPRRDAAV